MTAQADIDIRRGPLLERQWTRLQALLQTVLPMNAFWRGRLAGLTVRSLDEFKEHCPFLTKKMLVADREEHPPYGSNLTYPLENYTRFCQTSGTSGTPMAWLDSRDDWRAMLDCWEHIYSKAGIEPGDDRLFFAFSFGPFLGFWTAYEAAARMGCMVVPGGGLSTNARLQLMRRHRCTVLCCTPTYAIHLGEVKSADPELQAAAGWSLRTILVAGEPGGSVPEVRARIQALWPGVNVFDHHGLTEIGPVTYQDPKNPGRLIVLEEYYLAEVIDPASGREVLPGEEGELVLTNLRRLGGPLLRYKTGDIVCKGYTRTARLCLKGGVLGRYDDMVVIRGVNVFPSAVDAVVRKFPEVLEYQVREERRGAMLDLHVLAEAAAAQHAGQAAALRKKMEDALRDAFSLRIPVTIMRPQSLPRFEFKARRWIKEVARPGGGEGGG